MTVDEQTHQLEAIVRLLDHVVDSRPDPWANRHPLSPSQLANAFEKRHCIPDLNLLLEPESYPVESVAALHQTVKVPPELLATLVKEGAVARTSSDEVREHHHYLPDQCDRFFLTYPALQAEEKRLLRGQGAIHEEAYKGFWLFSRAVRQARRELRANEEALATIQQRIEEMKKDRLHYTDVKQFVHVGQGVYVRPMIDSYSRPTRVETGRCEISGRFVHVYPDMCYGQTHKKDHDSFSEQPLPDDTRCVWGLPLRFLRYDEQGLQDFKKTAEAVLKRQVKGDPGGYGPFYHQSPEGWYRIEPLELKSDLKERSNKVIGKTLCENVNDDWSGELIVEERALRMSAKEGTLSFRLRFNLDQREQDARQPGHYRRDTDKAREAR